jgi:hypothetical protein
MMKRSTLWFVTLILLVVGAHLPFGDWPATASASPLAEDPGWWAEYYANPGLYDGASLSRYESSINYDWGTGAPAPGLPADYFSVRWTRTTYFSAGTYKFCVTVDDGVRVWVDGQLIIDRWQLQGATTYCASMYLSAGTHVVQMAYFENTGVAVAKLWWTTDGVPPPTPTPPPYGWTGHYFNNKDLSGSPALTRPDADPLRFDWGTGAPAPSLPADNFSVRWTRDMHFSAGTYNFFAKHDDGVRLWVDGALVIDFWYDQPATTHGGTRALSAGTHQVKVEYYEHTGFASIVVWWDVDGIEPPPTPGPGAAVMVDNTDPGFLWGGPTRSRYTAYLGIGGSLYWTYNSTSNPVNYGKWVPYLSAPGKYEVFVYIPRNYATSTNVRYRILHNGQRHDRIINQRWCSDQWVSLGTYYFDAANVGREFVLVYDNTREPYASRMIAFDAVKFVPR